MRNLIGIAVLFSAVCLINVARAEVTSNTGIPVSITVFVPCANSGAGEDVTVTGTLHALTSATINGNNVSGKEQFQPQGLVGYGSVSGLKYQATGGTKSSFNTSLVNGQAVVNFVNNFKFSGQGPNNNFYVHEDAHITINADGTVTATQDNLSVGCK